MAAGSPGVAYFMSGQTPMLPPGTIFPQSPASLLTLCPRAQG